MIPISKPYIGEEEKQLVMEVLNSGMLAQGPKVAALEKRFAELSNVSMLLRRLQERQLCILPFSTWDWTRR